MKKIVFILFTLCSLCFCISCNKNINNEIYINNNCWDSLCFPDTIKPIYTGNIGYVGDKQIVAINFDIKDSVYSSLDTTFYVYRQKSEYDFTLHKRVTKHKIDTCYSHNNIKWCGFDWRWCSIEPYKIVIKVDSNIYSEPTRKIKSLTLENGDKITLIEKGTHTIFYIHYDFSVDKLSSRHENPFFFNNRITIHI